MPGIEEMVELTNNTCFLPGIPWVQFHLVDGGGNRGKDVYMAHGVGKTGMGSHHTCLTTLFAWS